MGAAASACVDRQYRDYLLWRFCHTRIECNPAICLCRDREEWLTAALFPGKNDRTQNISYETQAEALRQILGHLDFVFSKLTHIFRVGGARHLDSAGMDDTVS
jgi:hypothetical protein